jgi:type IV secretory pathway VirB4 component
MIEEARIVHEKQMEYNKAASFNDRRKLVFAMKKMKNKLQQKFIQFEEVMLIFKEEEDLTKSNPLIYIFHLIGGNIS